MSSKLDPYKKNNKEDLQQSRWNLSEELPATPFWSQKKWRKFGRVECRFSWR